MNKTEALVQFDAGTKAMRKLIESSGDADTVAVATCVTITPSAGDNMRVVCGTGGDATIVAFAISRLIKEALSHLPPEKHKDFRDLLQRVENCEEIRKVMLPNAVGQEKCPSTTLH
ncbi:hypothetical protein [Acetobacter sp. KSO5]|uniref:hypothetical protein n=1 Tax=Acetobacter sp. KSO5 TaxID=3373674 RepID=UPI00376EF051